MNFPKRARNQPYITAVSSDSRPPNPKCQTAIIVFDIWAQSLISQQGMVSAQFWGKYCTLCLFISCEILVCCEFEFGVFYWIDDRTWDKLIVAGRGFFSRVAGFVAGRGFLTKIAGFFAGIFFAGFFSRVLISCYAVLARGGARCITSTHRRMYSFQNIRFIF